MQSNDPFCCEHLLHQYKDQIVVGRKSAKELLAWLKKVADIEHIPLSSFGPRFLASFYYNFSHTYYSEIHGIQKEDLQLQGYRLVQGEANRRYYHTMTSTSDFIYLIIDIPSAQIQSNCGLLFLETSIQRGIDASDIASRSLFLKEYLIQLENLRSDP